MFNKIILDIFANIFDYYPDENFIKKFIVNENGINIQTICSHPFLKLSITYSYIWNVIYKTYPTKKDFVGFTRQFNYNIDSIINIDKTIFEQVINSFMHVRLGVMKNFNLDDIFKKFSLLIEQLKSQNFIESFIKDKLRYRFSVNLDDNNLISTVIKIIKQEKKCTTYDNYNEISSSTFDDYDEPINFTELDHKFMTDYEKKQYILYKDYHFCLKLINNVSIYVDDNTVPDDVIKTIVSAYESLDKHVVLLNYPCIWHDDLFTFPNITPELYSILPSVCEYHVTISHNLYPTCKSLAITRENSLYYLRSPVIKNNMETSKHQLYDRYIINSVELVPENNNKYPLESYIVYDSYTNKITTNDSDSIYILSTKTQLTSEKIFGKDIPNVYIENNDTGKFYDFVISEGDDITHYLQYMMNGSIIINIGKTVYIKHMINGILVNSIDDIGSVIEKLITTDDGKIQKKLLMRSAITMNYILDTELMESLWKLHIKYSCPIRSKNPRNGMLLYIHFAMIYFIKHLDKIIGLNNKIALPNDKSSNIMILVDNRPNYLSILSVLFSMCNVNATWKCRIYTSKKGLSFYEKWLGSIAEIIHTPLLDTRKFHIDIYNKLLMDENFWNDLQNYEKCLIVQDDGVLLRKGIERFMKFDYVGAPWIDVPDNKYLKDHINRDLVGNGGFSFRTIEFMRKITSTYQKEKKNLFYKNLNNIPEDVYFVKFLKKLDANMPTMKEALIFSSEEIICQESLGFHKIWCYHNPEDTKSFFKNILSNLEKPI